MSLTKRGTAFLVKEEVVENVTNVLRIYPNKKREQRTPANSPSSPPSSVLLHLCIAHS